MALIVNPNSELIREPNFLIPGKKPTGSVKVNFNHNLTKDIQAFWCPLPQNGLMDLVNNNMPSAVIGAGWEACSEGLGWRTSQDGHYLLYPYHPRYNMPSGSGYTLFWRGYLYNNTDNFGLMANVTGTDVVDGEWMFYVTSPTSELKSRSKQGGYATVDWASGNWPGAYPYLYSIAFTLNGTTGEHQYNMVHDGTLYTDSEIDTDIIPWSTAQSDIIIGDRMQATPTNFVNGIHLVAGIWKREMGAAELLELHADPYQLLIPA